MMSLHLRAIAAAALLAAAGSASESASAGPFLLSGTDVSLRQDCAGPPAGLCANTVIDRLTINGPASGGAVSASDSFTAGGQQASASVTSTVGAVTGTSSAANLAAGSDRICDPGTGLDCAFASGGAFGFAGRGHVLHSSTLADGTIVTLHLGFHFLGALGAHVFDPSHLCCGAAKAQIGPYVAYGSSLPVSGDNFFGAFVYSLNNNASGIATPGTTTLAISEVGGAPVATIGGLATSTGPVGGALTLNPSAFFDVAIDATLGEPFWLGIGLSLDSTAQLCAGFCDGTSFASGTLYFDYLNAPDGVTIAEFPGGSVPEPDPRALLAAGLALFGVSRRVARSAPFR
jgi:hypothetical protein